MPPGDVIKIQLEKIVQGADAIGRIDGKPVFVEAGAPCETVLCRITEDHKTWIRAELLEIIEKSPVRTDSVCAQLKQCAFYKKCGGCNLQHIDYNAQLEIKASILKESFLRIGSIETVHPDIFPSPSLEYRNRMQFHCFRQKQCAQNVSRDNCGFGLKGNDGEIIAINDCPIAVNGIRDILKGARRITLPVEKDRFTVFSKDDVFLNEGDISRGKIKLLDKEIILDAQLFFQSNCYMLEKLIIELRKIASEADQNAAMADLYCGVGTFSVFLAEMFPKIILTEINKTAVSIARENLCGKNTKFPAEFFALKDTDWPVHLMKRSFGFAVIDPPRAGMNSALAAMLAKNGPPLLAYISCDAASIARDAKILVNGGYQLSRLMMFDFYPHTAHIEALAVFKRQRNIF